MKKKYFPYEGLLCQVGVDASTVRARDIKMKPITLTDQEVMKLKEYRKPGFNHAIVTGVEAWELFYKKTDLLHVKVKFVQTASGTGMAAMFTREDFDKMKGGAQ